MIVFGLGRYPAFWRCGMEYVLVLVFSIANTASVGTLCCSPTCLNDCGIEAGRSEHLLR